MTHLQFLTTTDTPTLTALTTKLRATGPVIFSKCSLRETTFTGADLAASLCDDCELNATEFDGGTYRGLDLCGNDLSRVRGLASLKRILIDRHPSIQLAEALTADLDVTFGEDLGNS